MKLGDTVFTIGAPMGLEYSGTVTKGILSARRSIAGIEYLQTDAAINPGNSGGGLFNIKGELLGINTWKIANEDIEGMGFAIPIDSISEDLLEYFQK